MTWTYRRYRWFDEAGRESTYGGIRRSTVADLVARPSLTGFGTPFLILSAGPLTNVVTILNGQGKMGIA